MTATATPAAVAALPPCPDWCPGDCVGGRTEHLGGGATVTLDRVHELTLMRATVVDGDSYRGTRTIDLRVFVERRDSVDPDEPAAETKVVLEVEGRTHAVPAAAQLREMRDLFDRAADLLDAAEVRAAVAA